MFYPSFVCLSFSLLATSRKNYRIFKKILPGTRKNLLNFGSHLHLDADTGFFEGIFNIARQSIFPHLTSGLIHFNRYVYLDRKSTLNVWSHVDLESTSTLRIVFAWISHMDSGSRPGSPLRVLLFTLRVYMKGLYKKLHMHQKACFHSDSDMSKNTAAFCECSGQWYTIVKCVISVHDLTAPKSQCFSFGRQSLKKYVDDKALNYRRESSL